MLRGSVTWDRWFGVTGVDDLDGFANRALQVLGGGHCHLWNDENVANPVFCIWYRPLGRFLLMFVFEILPFNGGFVPAVNLELDLDAGARKVDHPVHHLTKAKSQEAGGLRKWAGEIPTGLFTVIDPAQYSPVAVGKDPPEIETQVLANRECSRIRDRGEGLNNW